MKIKITEVSMTPVDATRLYDILWYGDQYIAQYLYPHFKSEYDEDAGVYTDYGQNTIGNTLAQLNMCNLATVQNLEWSDVGSGR